jgi:hypothetical protein
MQTLAADREGDFESGSPEQADRAADELTSIAGPLASVVLAESAQLTANVARMTQDAFYPLVGTLLTTLGLPTRITRRGDTGLRFDAVIIEEDGAVPIEIKSPTEVDAASVKAVQQALENRIVLLSRRFFSTGSSSTSLVVSYLPAAGRSDVTELVDDIWRAYGVRIGLIDLASLYGLLMEKNMGGRAVEREDILELRGTL